MRLERRILGCIAYIPLIFIVGGSVIEEETKSSSSSSVRNNATSTVVPVLTSGLYWDKLSVRDVKGKFLLHTFYGHVENGQVCGILGSSGAGKSTLISSLGGTISSSSGLQVNGESFYYDKEKETKESLKVQGGRVAWMQQNDNFFDMLTVFETLQLASFLELPRFSEKQRRRRVKSIMESLGLMKLKDRRIGDSTVHNGLSGGEKRRLSLALELVSVPKLFLADEPSSGLDSTMSEKVVSLIQKLVQQRNIPCILSLHQPRSSIFKMLDSLILLGPGGYVCYHGIASDAVSYFATLGYICPPQTNPAEFLLDLVSIDSEDDSQACEDEIRISWLAASFAESQKSSHSWSVSMPLPNPNPPPIKDIDIEIEMEKEDHVIEKINLKDLAINPSQRNAICRFRPIKRFGRLLLRSWRQNIRNNRVNIFRLLASGGNAYLFTKIFNTIKKGSFTARSVADRVALLSFSVINMRYVRVVKYNNLCVLLLYKKYLHCIMLILYVSSSVFLVRHLQ
jgi:ABC-type multidrug transport system ATPase subunit